MRPMQEGNIYWLPSDCSTSRRLHIKSHKSLNWQLARYFVPSSELDELLFIFIWGHSKLENVSFV